MRNSKSSGISCPGCGKSVHGMPPYAICMAPDAIADALDADEESRVDEWGDDFMILDRERFFVQCAAMIPINGTPERKNFAWGIWIEVSKENFFTALEFPFSDRTVKQTISGRIANHLPAYECTCAQEVSICIETGTERRFVHFPPESQHAFAREQRDGIDSARQKEILVEYAKAIEDVELLDHVYKVSENGVDQRADRPTRSSRPGEQRTNNGVAAGVARPRTKKGRA